MVKFKCLCCDHEQEFRDAEEAFRAGWDAPPHFTAVQPLCDLCPAAPIALKGLAHARHRHAESHARWAREGRPKEYELENEQRINGEEPKTFEELKASVHAQIAKIFGGQVKH